MSNNFDKHVNFNAIPNTVHFNYSNEVQETKIDFNDVDFVNYKNFVHYMHMKTKNETYILKDLLINLFMMFIFAMTVIIVSILISSEYFYGPMLKLFNIMVIFIYIILMIIHCDHFLYPHKESHSTRKIILLYLIWLIINIIWLSNNYYNRNNN